MHASSYIGRKEKHPPEHAFDGNVKTAWNEGAPGPGDGEWIEAVFAAPRLIRSVTLATGYAVVSKKYGDLFYLNSHLKTVRLLLDGETVATREVGESTRQIEFDGLERKAKRVRILADEVWPGTRWQDLCISEIGIYGY